MVIPAHQAKQFANECAALLHSKEHLDLREASYVAASEIDVFYFDALRLIKEAVEKGDLSGYVVREMHEWSDNVREYVDVSQSRIALADLKEWLEALPCKCACNEAG